MEGTNPLTMSEGLSTDTSLSLGRILDLENTKLLPKVLKLHPSQWLSQHIIYLFVCRNILELHYSSLHHILDIVISNIYAMTHKSSLTRHQTVLQVDFEATLPHNLLNKL